MSPIDSPPPAADSIPRILLVDDEPELLELVGEVAKRHVKCEITTASNMLDAREILETQPIDLLVTDVHLPDGDGMALIELLQLHQPNASAMVITGAPSVDRAVNAIRHGALDFLPKPFTHDQLLASLKSALSRAVKHAKKEQRFDRLKSAVKRLNESRRLITRKVDLLCNDLVTAYGELSRQLDGVRTQESFRKYIATANDLEQLLCHAMDWLMRQLGYSNVAVWLAADEGEFQLGAYMKYTIAGDPLLTDALKRAIVPMIVRNGAMHGLGGELSAALTPQELSLLKDQDMLGANCTYLGESLATVLFFRDSRTPFSAEDEAVLKAISPIFAVALATVVRKSEGEAGEDESPFLEGDTMSDFDDKEKPRRDAADWWKTGEEPPF